MMNRTRCLPNKIIPSCSRLLSAQAAPRPESGAASLPAAEINVETLRNGITMAAIQSNSPLSTVSLVIRGGSRAEDENSLGASHCLRTCAGLATRNNSAFLITRNVLLSGCTLSAAGSREYLAVTLTGLREKVEANIGYLTETVFEPSFKPWEVHDLAVPRMKVERALMEQNGEAMLIEALHEAAFRGPLSHSLYSPTYSIGSHTQAVLNAYLLKTLQPKNIVALGTGVSARGLGTYLDENAHIPASKSVSNDPPSGFLGNEVRVDTPSAITRVALVSEGACGKNTKDRLALELFGCLLGHGGRIPYSSGGLSTRLGLAASKVAKEPFATSVLNINYSDVGLFGFTVACAANETRAVVKALVSQMRETAKKMTEKDIQAAKNQLKAKIMLEGEGDRNLVSWLADEAIISGAILSPQEMGRAIDGITLQDVTSMAGKVVKGRGALAAVGKLHDVPHLDELA